MLTAQVSGLISAPNRCYDDYLASDHWRQRRADYEASHPRRCRYCGGRGDHLHHRRYEDIGAEPDDDLEWVCADHHAEITKYGSIQPVTERQREILREHRYAEEYVARISFGTAFELIGAIARGEVRTPA